MSLGPGRSPKNFIDAGPGLVEFFLRHSASTRFGRSGSGSRDGPGTLNSSRKLASRVWQTGSMSHSISASDSLGSPAAEGISIGPRSQFVSIDKSSRFNWNSSWGIGSSVVAKGGCTDVDSSTSLAGITSWFAGFGCRSASGSTAGLSRGSCRFGSRLPLQKLPGVAGASMSPASATPPAPAIRQSIASSTPVPRQPLAPQAWQRAQAAESVLA